MMTNENTNNMDMQNDPMVASESSSAGTPGDGGGGGIGSKKQQKSAAAVMQQAEDIGKSLQGGEKTKPHIEQLNIALKELKDFVWSKTNINGGVKAYVLAVMAVAGKVERELRKTKEQLAKAQNESSLQPAATPSQVPNKHKRKMTPGSGSDATPVTTKKPKNAPSDRNEWKTIHRRQKGDKPKEARTVKEKVVSKKVKPKADALSIGIENGKPEMYADVLKKLKSDSKLKELGNQVSRIRKARNGDMLIELRDPAVKSTAYKELIQDAVREAGVEKFKVKALTQEIVVECRNMDEITTADDLRDSLKSEFRLLDSQCDGKIRMRRSYGSTQIGTIKLPVDVANKLLEAGKIKVGWSVCELRIQREPLRCHRCLGFGHMKANCKGEDRSKACWKCGEVDEDKHQSKDCKKAPKCLLCSERDGNNHSTGSLRCKAYRDAAAKK